jgi:repressor LexA
MLTPTQHKTYEYIKQFIAKHGYAPTTGEIAKGIQINSRGVVYRYLQALVKKRLIQLMPNRRRNIQLIREEHKFLPLVGKIAAGSPIEAITHQETINIVDIFLGHKRFALRVKGDSMIEEGILDGDIVVCERCESAENGQIIVALIDNEQATLKRLQRNSNGTLTLKPANTKHKPQIYTEERVQIQGIFIGLLRF